MLNIDGAVAYGEPTGPKTFILKPFDGGTPIPSNSKLKQNLAKQVEVYKAANQTKKSIEVILYFTDFELKKLLKILKDLELSQGKELVLIDARATNKPLGANAK